MKKKETYIVYGSKGYIGSKIINLLRKKKQKIICVKKNLYSKKIGNVIYCVGSDDWSINPFKTYNSNFVHLYNFFKKKIKYKTFTYISTTRLYLNLKNKIASEDDDLVISKKKNSIFNLQKLMSESLLSFYKNIKIIRLSNVYGYCVNKKTILPTIIRDSILKKKIIISINLNSQKDFISENDAVRNIYLLVKKKKLSGTYNLGSGKNTKIKKILSIIKKYTNCNIKFLKNLSKESYPKLNLSKIKGIINFSIKNDILKDLPNIIKKTKILLKKDESATS